MYCNSDGRDQIFPPLELIIFRWISGIFDSLLYMAVRRNKKRLKIALWGFFNTAAVRPILFLPQQVPAFTSRGATHHTDARDLYQRRRELLPMNFASKSVIHENPLSSLTCRKAGTWDILFYFPSEGRHTEDFPDVRKIQRLRRNKLWCKFQSVLILDIST